MKIHQVNLPNKVVPWKADKTAPVEKKEVKQVEWWLTDLVKNEDGEDEERQVCRVQLLRVPTSATSTDINREITARARILVASLKRGKETVRELK